MIVFRICFMNIFSLIKGKRKPLFFLLRENLKIPDCNLHPFFVQRKISVWVDFYADLTYIKSMNQVRLSKKAQEQLKKIPAFITANLQIWVEQVEMFGISKVRRVPGYHDKPLHGERLGQRSIRLSKAYRAFYIEHDDYITIEVIEVNKHEY